MRLVDEQKGAGLTLDGGDLLERRDIAEHAVDAFDDNEFVTRTVSQQPEAPIKIIGVIVPETRHLRGAEARAIIDAGMAVGIEQQVVVASGQTRQGAEIGLVAGGKDHGIAAAEKRGDPFFQSDMSAVGAVRDAGAGGSGAFGLQGRHRLRDAALVECDAEIVVGPEEHHGLPVQARGGRRQDLIETDGKGVAPGLQGREGACQLCVFAQHLRSLPVPARSRWPGQDHRRSRFQRRHLRE